jgi:ABC-type ATPase with predicted acetyltransferase domain
MTSKPRLESLIKAHSKASAMTSNCGLKLLHARQSGDPVAARAIKRQLRFWKRRFLRMDAKIRAAP